MWKDVDGVLSADPRRVHGATPVPFLTFDEATELAYFGAQVPIRHSKPCQLGPIEGVKGFIGRFEIDRIGV